MKEETGLGVSKKVTRNVGGLVIPGLEKTISFACKRSDGGAAVNASGDMQGYDLGLIMCDRTQLGKYMAIRDTYACHIAYRIYIREGGAERVLVGVDPAGWIDQPGFAYGGGGVVRRDCHQEIEGYAPPVREHYLAGIRINTFEPMLNMEIDAAGMTKFRQCDADIRTRRGERCPLGSVQCNPDIVEAAPREK